MKTKQFLPMLLAFAIALPYVAVGMLSVFAAGGNTYVITGCGTEFTAKVGATAIGTDDQPIQTVINAIKADAGSADCTIQFEDLTNTLDIGTANITLDGGTGGTEWGTVTLTGKVTSEYCEKEQISATVYKPLSGIITVLDGVVVNSTAEVANTSTDDASCAIYHNSTGALNISGGTVWAGDGDFATPTNPRPSNTTRGIAVYGCSSGKITFSGNAVVTSTNPDSSYLGAIMLDKSATGEVEITDNATVRNPNGASVFNNSAGTVTIGGNAIIESWGAVVINNSIGTVNIGGNAQVLLKSIISSNASAIHNLSSGIISISGGTVSATDVNHTTGNGVLNDHLSGTVNISGGRVEATSGTAVKSNGPVNASGTAVITSSSSGGTIICAGEIKMSGGEVSNTHATGNAIDHSASGTITISGGTISANRGAAIHNTFGTVAVSGGSISATTGVAIKSSGNVTVSGAATAITSANVTSRANRSEQDTAAAQEGTIYLSGASIEVTGGTVSNTSAGNAIYISSSSSNTLTIGGGNISSASGDAIYIYSNGTAAISAGNISTTSGRAVFKHYNRTVGSVSISGGTVSATSGFAVLGGGTLDISGGTVSATTGTAVSFGNVSITVSGDAVISSAGEKTIEQGCALNIIGNATVKNTSGGMAVDNHSGDLFLGGNPTVTGSIIKGFPFGKCVSVIVGGENEFDPSPDKIYTLGFEDIFSHIGVVVNDGADFFDYFELSPSSALVAELAEEGNNIVLAFQLSKFYVFNKSGNTYTIMPAPTSSPGIAIQTVINNIRDDASGSDCTIQFGDGTNPLFVSLTSIKLNNTGGTWGKITLTGKLIGSWNEGTDNNNTANGTIDISGNVSVDSEADITHIGKYGAAIRNNGSGTLTISSGTVETTAGNSTAIRNSSTGTVSITGGTVKAPGAANPIGNGHTIVNSPGGTVAITGGLVFAYGSGAANVIYGAYDDTNGNPVIMAWDVDAGNTVYTADTDDDITLIAGTTAQWDLRGGIAYANGANAGFIALPVKVVEKTPVSNTGYSEAVTYAGATFDLSALASLFTVDANAGTPAYTIDGGTGTGSIGVDNKTLTVTKAGTLTIGLITAETATHQAGAKVTATLTVNKGTQSTPAGLGKADVTTYGGSDGKLTGLTASTNYEYKKDGGSYMAAMSNASGEITGLATGSYVVRLAANDLYNESADSAALVIVQPPSSITVSGLIKSYNPQHESALELWRAGEAEAAYNYTIPKEENGSGQREQRFTFSGVAPGTYTLIISKAAHTSFTVRSIVVIDNDVDLMQDARPEVRLMTLRCGDINGDGNINNSDLTILWQQANYNRSAGAAANELCDLNGDGLINNSDLTILWLAYNYNRGEIEIK
jgi:hypothetical protein